MALSNPSSTISDLRHIAATARSISLAVGGHLITYHPEDVALEDNFSLPPPPSIRTALDSLGLPSFAVQKTLGVYEQSAQRYRQFSQTNMRRAIQACRQFPAWLSDDNLHLVRVATTKAYMRTLRDMGAMVVSLCQENVQKAHSSRLSLAIPRTLSSSLPPSLPCTQRSANLSPVKSAAHCQGPYQSGPISDTSMSFEFVRPRSTRKSLTFMDGPNDRKSETTPVFKIACEREGDDYMSSVHDSAAYPARYNHTRPACLLSFASNSEEFFFAPVTANRSRSSLQVTDGIVDHLSKGVGGLRVGKVNHPSQEPISTHRGVIPRHTSLSSDKHASTFSPQSRPRVPTVISTDSNNISTISLDVSTCTTTSLPLRFPSRRPVECQPSPPLRQARPPSCTSRTSALQPFTSGSPCISSSTLQQAPVAASITPISSAPRTGRMRRKVAPLPRRQPTTTSRTDVVYHTSSGGAAQLTLASSPFTPHRSSAPISRTPSLASLASSCSDSPSSTDDNLDTPPSSPQMHPQPHFAPYLRASTGGYCHSPTMIAAKISPTKPKHYLSPVEDQFSEFEAVIKQENQ